MGVNWRSLRKVPTRLYASKRFASYKFLKIHREMLFLRDLAKHKSSQEHFAYPMETLKSFDNLLEPDPRYGKSMNYMKPTLRRTYTLEIHYERYALLKPPQGAPEEVIGSFVTALHLAILSWYVFPLSTVAIAQAYNTLELALRRRMNNSPARGLKDRMLFAIKVGWFKPDQILVSDPFLGRNNTLRYQRRAIDPHGRERFSELVENLPRDRNWLAHGNFSRGSDPFMDLDVVCQLLGQIYSN